MNPVHPFTGRRLPALLAALALILLSACSKAQTEGSAPSEPPSSESETALSSSAGGASSSAASSESPFPKREESPQEEILTIETFDSLSFDGKLRLPESGSADKLVIFVNGSGPNTYDNKRMLSESETFDYFDLFAREITKRGAAFFSYNTRGVTPGDTPPLYADIDEAVYETYTPNNEVQDVETIIQRLTSHERLQGCKVYLLGWSEGTIIAPLVVKGGTVPVDALLLAGYCNRRMEEILDWQQTGGSSMVNMRRFFDYDGDGAVTLQEVEEDRYQVRDALGLSSFEELDQNGNGQLDEADFAAVLAPSREALYKAIEERDDEWLAENYGVRLTTAWFEDHRRIAPNSETLPTLELPIYIFQGQYDANTPVEDSYAIEKAFQDAGKTNLTLEVFPGHDHDLNYTEYLVSGEVPEGIQAILDTIEQL